MSDVRRKDTFQGNASSREAASPTIKIYMKLGKKNCDDTVLSGINRRIYREWR